MDDVEILSKIKSRVNLVELISEYTQLNLEGLIKVGNCPFENCRENRFQVDPQSNFYRCFGCGASGDIFSFIQRVKGIGFIDAAQFLAQKYSVD